MFALIDNCFSATKHPWSHQSHTHSLEAISICGMRLTFGLGRKSSPIPVPFLQHGFVRPRNEERVARKRAFRRLKHRSIKQAARRRFGNQVCNLCRTASRARHCTFVQLLCKAIWPEFFHDGTHDLFHELHRRRSSCRGIGYRKIAKSAIDRTFEEQPIGPIPRNLIKRKDIHPNARTIASLGITLLDPCRLVNDLGKRTWSRFVAIRHQLESIVASALVEHRQKALVVGAQHHNVHVVVPGNEAPVANSAQTASVAKNVFYIVLSAYPINIAGDVEFDLPHFLQGQLFQNLVPLSESERQQPDTCLH